MRTTLRSVRQTDPQTGIVVEIGALIKPSPIAVEIGPVTINGVDGATQEKTVTPTRERQFILPDVGYAALARVTVEAIPKEYGLITYDQDKNITVS